MALGRVVTEAHRKRSRVADVEAMQERHSPTVEIAVDDGTDKRRTRSNFTRVRQSEAWRHNQLSGMQRQAEVEMAMIWQERTQGLRMKSTNLFLTARGNSGSRLLNFKEELLHVVWADFVREAKRRRINFRVVIAVLTEPQTLAEVEHRHRLKKGRAFAIYTRGLDLWCVLRGWVRRGRFGGVVDNSA